MVSLTSALALISAGLYLDGRVRLSRDLAFAIPGLKTKLWFEKQLIPNNDVSLYNRFDDQVQIRPYAIALVFENQSYTWKGLEIASNKMAHWYQAQGIQPKDRVAMFMTNSPLFIISWLALLKIKAVAAFINNQISGPVLIHSLKTANAQLLVFDHELIEVLYESIEGIREMGYRLFTLTPKEQVLAFDEQRKEDGRFYEFMEWRQCSAEGYSRDTRRDVVIGDAVALIYTSGTTGFPKAAFTSPPFIAVRDQDVTMIQYIGELCRYLIHAPEDPRDKDHKVRLMFGNGMRPDVWRKFQQRFGVETVFESYTMSEATSALFNLTSGDDGAGAVGFRGPLVRTFQQGLRIVKVDLDTEELIKDKNGYCIECDYGETGELITLADNKTSQTRYIGYYNQPKLSNAKLIQNAFEEGDQYMRTGDLLYRTKDHFWYFADRAGDTFRWKGENVSTAEVADTLGHVDGITSCTVYGVTIPGQDGRAGMAAIVLKDEYWEIPIKQKKEIEKSIRLINERAVQEFVDRLGRHAAKRLPPYAIPRFIRICEGELEITGTFKNKKVELRKEGFDLSKVRERLYWWTPQGYQRFGARENEVILAGRARL
ncbi:hypothetical protein BGZ59_000813 [Podila verticillata]|nr:hypothetical protein BGZ59_000813 [Podila verticillata]